MRKLLLNTENLRVDSFATTDAEPATRGTVHAQSGTFCVGYSSGAPVCACDTTHTQRAPECDPSEQTFCVGNTLCE
jgi:hypothetical protein